VLAAIARIGPAAGGGCVEVVPLPLLVGGVAEPVVGGAGVDAEPDGVEGVGVVGLLSAPGPHAAVAAPMRENARRNVVADDRIRAEGQDVMPRLNIRSGRSSTGT